MLGTVRQALRYISEREVDSALQAGSFREARAALERVDEHRARHAYPTERHARTVVLANRAAFA